MNQICIGFLLIFLDFNFTFNQHVLGLIPDFAGYLVLLSGLRAMACESPLFEKIRPFAVGMAVYTGILYIGDLLGVTPSGSGLSIVLGILSTAVSLYISWAVITALRDVEEKREVNLNSASLLTVWKVVAVTNVVVYLSFFVPFLAILVILAALIANIAFLVGIWRAKGLYGALPPVGQSGPEIP